VGHQGTYEAPEAVAEAIKHFLDVWYNHCLRWLLFLW
jgi:hypothetical protein